MDIIASTASLSTAVQAQRRAGRRIAFVPTMGNLHEGHLRLIDTAREQADWVVASIFVNPLQFGPGEDLAAYPRTPEEDEVKLADRHCDLLFRPSVEEIYGVYPDRQTRLHVPGLSEIYCGASRPGHFDGVATVVCKLFNLVAPDLAVFGLKDYQQFLVIGKMVEDLALPVRLLGVETVREPSGLALSSRNRYLTADQRAQAAAISAVLNRTAAAIASGNRDYPALQQTATDSLAAAGLRPDYFAITEAHSLRPAEAQDRDLALLAAAWVGKSRLIDNLRLNLTLTS